MAFAGFAGHAQGRLAVSSIESGFAQESYGYTVYVQYGFRVNNSRKFRRIFRKLSMQRTNWWKYLLVVLVTGAAGVLFMGIKTYKDAPPKPDYVSSSGEEVFTRASTERGQLVFQKYALMEYGSMFGDGAARGPDFTAEALHQIAVQMNDYYGRQITNGRSAELTQIEKDGISVRVKRELKTNYYDRERGIVVLTDGTGIRCRTTGRILSFKIQGKSQGVFQAGRLYYRRL